MQIETEDEGKQDRKFSGSAFWDAISDVLTFICLGWLLND
jgi:hypothetical protein